MRVMVRNERIIDVHQKTPSERYLDGWYFAKFGLHQVRGEYQRVIELIGSEKIGNGNDGWISLPTNLNDLRLQEKTCYLVNVIFLNRDVYPKIAINEYYEIGRKDK